MKRKLIVSSEEALESISDNNGSHSSTQTIDSRILADELALELDAENIDDAFETWLFRSQNPYFSRIQSDIYEDSESQETKLSEFKISEREFTRRAEIIERIVEQFDSQTKSIVHFAIHTFEATANDAARKTDISIEYKPTINEEANIAKLLQTELVLHKPTWRIRLNSMHSQAHGYLPHSLRRMLTAPFYLGFDVFVNRNIIEFLSHKQIASILASSISKTVQPQSKRFLNIATG